MSASMRSLVMGAAALLLTNMSAHAITYDVDLTLDDYTYESVDGAWVYTAGADPVEIVGQIETDGTTGTIDASNILSWSFTISSTSGSTDISSEGLFGRVHTYGSFEATETSFSAGDGTWGFLEYTSGADSYVIGRVHGRDGNLHTYANFLDVTIDCDAGGCDATTNQGNRGIERDLQLLGTAQPAVVASLGNGVLPVPVPSSLTLALSAFGLFGLIGWRRRRFNTA